MKLNKMSSKTLNFILVAVAILFFILWLTVPNKKELVKDTLLETKLQNDLEVANANYKKLKEYSELSNLKIAQLELENKKIKEKIVYQTYIADKEVEVITNQSLKEDSAYFSAKTKEPVELISDSLVGITPMQLKFANINISRAESRKGIIETMSQQIDNYSLQLAEKDTLIFKQGEQVELYKNAMESSKQLLSIEQDKLKQQKKIDRKKKIRAGLIGGSIGVILGITILGIAG